MKIGLCWLPRENLVRLCSKNWSKPARGQEIGTIQGGFACLGQSKIFWKRGGQFQVGDEELIDTLKEELTKAGYQVVGDPNALFEDPKEWKAEFLIAGVIKHVAVNRCFPFIGFLNYTTSSGEASIEVEWQIYERRTQSVVVTTSTGGTAKADMGPNQGEQAYYDAFAAAVRNLLADQKVVSLLSRGPAKPLKDQGTLVLKVLALEAGDPSRSAAIVQYAQGAVVTIPIGTGHGSGFIVSTDGLVLTNSHVVGEGLGMVSVELSTGRRVAGQVLRVDKKTDVALIQLEKGHYLAIPVGSSSTLKVGTSVYAIGTPLDERFSRTVTKGIVSAFRDSDDGRKLIQSDVSILPGNSGGPLLDDEGRIVGLAQSGFMAGGKLSVGLNYFVPIDEAWKALQVQPELTKISLKELLGGQVLSPGVTSPSTPPSTRTVGKEKEIAEKLQIIQGLKQKGLISQEEAERRSKAALDEALK